jgi:hypothetical protein
VYTSLGEEEEEPATWRPLEEDFEFDEEIPQYSAMMSAASEKRKAPRPKLVGNKSKKIYIKNIPI